MRRRFSPQQILGDQQFGKLLLQIRNDPDRLFKKGSYERINGKSNLSSRVLINCCRSVGLDPSIFSDFLTFIDSDLLDKRNYVAHGESLRIEAGDIPEYRDKVVDLMRVTQNGFENAAVTKSYLRQAPLPLSLQVGSN